MIEEIKDKICLCVINGYRKKVSKTFDTYEELLKWTQEQIEEESKINIGDDVEIIDEDIMYISLGTDFFTKVYWNSGDNIDEEKMFDIIRYYRYNNRKGYNGLIGSVIAEYDGKYIIELPNMSLELPNMSLWNDSEYIIIEKKGVKKVNA